MNNMQNRIAIMGVGMVGGALARYFEEEKDLKLACYDPPKGLSDLESLNDSDIVFVCVPTPFDHDKNQFDKTYLDQAIGVLTGSKIVVIKSTVIPGTTDEYQTKYPEHKFLFNPEFLTEATADEDTRKPKRQIIGFTKKSKDVAKMVLDFLPRASFESIIGAKEAEMVKYFTNSFFALKVAFVNQIYDLCEKMGINYDEIKKCAKEEPMMGTNHFDIFHKNYRGYGGKCLPKDVKALLKLAEDCKVDLSILKQAEDYNKIIQDK